MKLPIQIICSDSMMLLLKVLVIFSPCFVHSAVLNIDDKIPFVNYKPLVEELPGYGVNWMYFPDGNGVPQIVELNVTSEVASRFILPVEQNTEFHLYTRANQNDSKMIYPDNNGIPLRDTNFDPAKPTKIVIHGWTSSHSSDLSQNIKNNFLQDQDCNVILINWENIAGTILYPIAAKETKNVGNYVGTMVDYLVENGVKLEDIHIIGHSLGAHVAGNAGEAVKSGRVKRITGLDPALPGFEIVSPNDRKLDPSDADFVDIIHTCGGILGYYTTLGHADFYPNGGVPSQPGCFGVPQIIEGCSHGRSWKYFAESIKDKSSFMAAKCDNWDSFVKGECMNNTIVPMGIATPSSARGKFYLQTENREPFAKQLDFSQIVKESSGIIRTLRKYIPFVG